MDKSTAYHEWLGIPKTKQPPNYYNLLNLTEFEQNKVVIENAAARNIFFLQRFFGSPFAELAQEIQKEIAEAKKILCGDGKEAYDIDLAKAEAESIESAGMDSEEAGCVTNATFLATTTNSKDFQSGDFPSYEDIIEKGIRSSIELAEKRNWLIGWDPEKCDIIVDNQFVSAKHCVLFAENDYYEIEDLDSTNGTFLNGKKLPPRKRYRVTFQDEVTLGKKTIMPWPPIDS